MKLIAILWLIGRLSSLPGLASNRRYLEGQTLSFLLELGEYAVGAILLYTLFCCVVIVAVLGALLAGFPIGIVGQLGVWAVAAGAIAAVLYRYVRKSG